MVSTGGGAFNMNETWDIKFGTKAGDWVWKYLYIYFTSEGNAFSAFYYLRAGPLTLSVMNFVYVRFNPQQSRKMFLTS